RSRARAPTDRGAAAASGPGQRSPSPSSCETARLEVRAQVASRVVERLVERVPVAVEPLGEHVDRHAVERERDEYLPLARRQRRLDPLLDRGEELRPLEARGGCRRRALELRPGLWLER